MSHITGGGLTNIARILPGGLGYDVPYRNVPTPTFMKAFQEWGGVDDDEAFTVWNMGMGFALVVDSKDVAIVREAVPGAFVAGEVVTKPMAKSQG